MALDLALLASYLNPGEFQTTGILVAVLLGAFLEIYSLRRPSTSMRYREINIPPETKSPPGKQGEDT